MLKNFDQKSSLWAFSPSEIKIVTHGTLSLTTMTSGSTLWILARMNPIKARSVGSISTFNFLPYKWNQIEFPNKKSAYFTLCTQTFYTLVINMCTSFWSFSRKSNGNRLSLGFVRTENKKDKVYAKVYTKLAFTPGHVTCILID